MQGYYRTIFSAASLIALLGACQRTPDAQGSGKRDSERTIAIASSADADLLFPPLTLSVQGKQVTDQIFDNLADVGPSLNTIGDADFRPRLARSWRWSPDSTSIDFQLHSRARWHDGVPVRAEDVRFTYALVKDTTLGSPLASNLANIDSVSTPDSLTARIWLHRRAPDAFFNAASVVSILPAHLLRTIAPGALATSAFARHPVGSGRFRFSRWDQGSRIVLSADSTNYRGRPQADRVVWLISQDYNPAALQFLSGAADFIDVVHPDLIAKVRAAHGLHVETAPSLDYGYVGFNLRNATGTAPHRLFADRALRRALVMAVDRGALVRNVFDTLGVVGHGPVTRAIPTSDTTIGIAYDLPAAMHILDSLGWRSTASGIRARRGVSLAFTLIVPTSSAIRMRFAVLLQSQWRKAGADVRIEPLELNAFGARLETRSFDAMLNAWHIDPDPASIRDEWTRSAMAKGGYNMTSYSSPAFDALVDSATHTFDPAVGIVLYRRAYRQLTEDAPAMWLYELRSAFGVSDRIHPVGLRADAWWSNLADWRVVGGSSSQQ